MAEAAAETKNSVDLAGITARIEALIRAGKVGEVEAVAAEFTQSCPAEAERLLVEGVVGFLKGQYAEVVAKFVRVKELLADEDPPALTSIYSNVLVQSQLALPRRQRPGVVSGYEYYKKNIAVLREVDAHLAAEVQACRWPDGLTLVTLWDGLYLCSEGRTLSVMNEEVQGELRECVGRRKPLAFGGVGGGQEIRYALAHQVNVLHGMARAHYLFEPNAELIRVLLHMFDLCRALRECWLVILGGDRLATRVEEVFGSFLYPVPDMAVGDTSIVREQMNRIEEIFVREGAAAEAEAYYSSAEFRARQQDIANGTVLPRVLLHTCRWTTFLKYCTADFETAFAGLGCPTRYVIEQNDVQRILPSYHWRELRRFKPDMVFMVSHGRPSLPYMPRELPFVGFIQDKCGPILQCSDLSEHITRQDLFIGMMNEFERYLRQKQVPADQVFVMPIPADEAMFFPLGDDESPDTRFISDVGYVKHGHARVELVREKFFRDRFSGPDDTGSKRRLAEVFEELYQAMCLDGDNRHYEAEMQNFVSQRFGDGIGPDARNLITRIVAEFYIVVYSAAWRCCFLEAVDRAGIELSLYGSRWDEHERLSHLHKGPVARDRELNYVYNFNRINLSINQGATMHQRLSECGLAGGFMMVADHPAELDWGPARPYFQEDREVVFFDTRADLVDKCRYYLEHDDERRVIAGRMRERALRERTCLAGAQTVLTEWRKLLRKSLGAHGGG